MEQGQRIFVLAQLWIKSGSYRNYILEQKVLGKWITLDNGAGDHCTVSPQDLLEITMKLMPNEVIALDILFDKDATIYNLDRFIDMMKANDLLDKVEIFGCPQGSTKADWFECYQYMLDNPDVTTIGLSKIAVPYIYKTGSKDAGIMEARHLCYEELKSLDLIKKPIHCLGAGDPREFLKYINDPLMRSTDSCFSVWSAMNDISWNNGNFERITTPLDYFDRNVTEEQAILAASNVDFLKKVLNTGR
jgi:queuine/archaeosine tRNA-ribosyltransferase